MAQITRRQFSALLPALAIPALAIPSVGQEMSGIVSRGVKPLPRGKASGLPFHSSFINVAKAAGLHAPVIYGAPGHTDYILEAMGCGAAFIDYDNDGWLDIVQLTGRRYQDTPPEAIIRLYKNNRDGTFTDVTAKSGLGVSVWACGITVGDYDNDGFDDLFITCWGQNLLFHNNGDGSFTDVTKPAGLFHEGTRYGTGCTWIDYDRDGKLDLFVSHYLVFDPAKVAPTGKNAACNWKGVPVNCGPTGFPQEPCRLYHNNGDGTFTDVSEKAGISKVKPGFALTAVAADFTGDGWQDIYVACDTSASLLFRNNRDGTFTEVALERGAALNEDGQEQAGMGVGIGDFNSDGAIDILKTHFTEDTPVLYENDGHGSFRDVTISAGLGVETRFVSWGAAIADFDNDGLPDLFFATGMVYPEPEAKLHAYPYKTPCVLYRNLGGGHFEELLDAGGPGLHESHSSRGVAFGDFDNDGDIDILIVNLNEPPSLLRNDVSGNNHWLKVLLQGVQSNRSAIGARVLVSYGNKRQVQAVTAQSSYVSANDRRLHFGLGMVTSASIEIHWPNGKEEKIGKVDAGQLVTIREGSGVIKTERFRPKRLPENG